MTFQELMQNECGYTTITTFWEDFSIADRFGIDAVNDTFHRAWVEWKTNYKYITELVLVLNHKAWQYAESNETLAKVYIDLYKKLDGWCMDNLEGEELSYYLQITD